MIDKLHAQYDQPHDTQEIFNVLNMNEVSLGPLNRSPYGIDCRLPPLMESSICKCTRLVRRIPTL